jgi:hypothetical protein
MNKQDTRTQRVNYDRVRQISELLWTANRETNRIFRIRSCVVTADGGD